MLVLLIIIAAYRNRSLLLWFPSHHRSIYLAKRRLLNTWKHDMMLIFILFNLMLRRKRLVGTKVMWCPLATRISSSSLLWAQTTSILTPFELNVQGMILWMRSFCESLQHYLAVGRFGLPKRVHSFCLCGVSSSNHHLLAIVFHSRVMVVKR
jgi:hypothetical protein